VDERDLGKTARTLLPEHSIQDASGAKTGERRTISKQMLYVEIDAAGRLVTCTTRLPRLRPLKADEPGVRQCSTVPRRVDHRRLEQKALGYAIAHVVPGHIKEVTPADWSGSPRTRCGEERSPRRSATGTPRQDLKFRTGW